LRGTGTPPPPDELKVIAFAGGWNLPIWVAQRQGFFEQQGLAVQLSYTPGSAFLVNGLMSGRFDLALAAIDNLVAYQEGQGDGAAAAGPGPGCGDGRGQRLSQHRRPAFADDDGGIAPAQARGRLAQHRVRVRAARAAAEERHRRSGRELRARRRHRASLPGLLAGQHDATLLRTPFDILAAERGFRVLATADTLGPYLGTSGMVRRSWARSHETALVAFLRGYLEAMRWLRDPANRGVAEALLVANLRDMTPALAARSAETLLASAADCCATCRSIRRAAHRARPAPQVRATAAHARRRRSLRRHVVPGQGDRAGGPLR
jgi:hypothetical protein